MNTNDIAILATQRALEHLGANEQKAESLTPNDRLIRAIFGTPESAEDKAARIAAMDSFQRFKYESEEKARMRRNR